MISGLCLIFSSKFQTTGPCFLHDPPPEKEPASVLAPETRLLDRHPFAPSPRPVLGWRRGVVLHHCALRTLRPAGPAVVRARVTTGVTRVTVGFGATVVVWGRVWGRRVRVFRTIFK